MESLPPPDDGYGHRWPQLPRYNIYADMYVLVSEHFPGMVIDEAKAVHRSPSCPAAPGSRSSEIRPFLQARKAARWVTAGKEKKAPAGTFF